MGMLSILEPSILHISTEDWYNESLAARFEQRWIDLIDALRDAESVGLDHHAMLSFAVELLLCDLDTGPAWTTERNARQRLHALYYQQLRPLLESIGVPTAYGVSAEPPIDDREPDDPWLRATLDLLSWAVDQAGELTIQAGVFGTRESLTHVVEDGVVRREAVVCHDHAEFLRLLPLHDLIMRATPSQLPRLLELSTQRFLMVNPDRAQVYSIEYADTFLNQLTGAAMAMKPHVADAIVSRVTQVQKTAQADKGLKDEPLGGRAGWRRCRVTRDWRIHYSYPRAAVIRLETVGPHDLGL